MNEIGAMLIEARTSQDLEVEQVSRETNIAREYIIALEKDDYTVFPAEPYVLGFLRNYAEYLGLNADEIISLYKQIKIQETSLPPEALLPKKGFKISKKIIVISAGVLLCVCLFFVGYFAFTKWIPAIKENKSAEVKTEKVVEQRQVASYELTESKFEKRLFENDELKLSVQDKEYTVKVLEAAPNLVLETNIGNQIIGLGQSLKIDLNNDLVFDIEITVEDIDKRNPENGALVSVLTGSEIQAAEKENKEDIIVSEETENKSLGNYIVLFESSSAYPVTLNATFRGYCLFRYEVDKKEQNREERYYQKSEQLTVQANNGFRIWASNGNVVKLQLVAGGKTVDLDVSRPGEIIVKDLKWIKDDVSKRFKFIAIDVD